MKKKIVTTFIIAMSLAVSGCGASGPKSYSETDGDRSYKSAAQAPANDSYGLYDSAATEAAYDSSAPEDYEVAEDSAADDMVAEAETTEGSSGSSSKENTTNKIDTEKLIYRCSISLETKEFDGSVASFQQIVSKYDGFIENENTSINSSGYGMDSNGLGYYTATVRVPSDKYKDFVNETGEIASLKNKSQNVTNVSQEYSDLTVEMEVLEAQRKDYMEMLKEAKSIEDMDNVILISDKLAAVNTQINQIKTRLNTIDNDVAYSYVDITIQEVREIVEYTEDSFGTRFMREVKQGWYNFGYGAQNLCIWFVANIWGLLVFALIVFIIVLIIKKIIKNAKKRSEEKRARMYQNPAAAYQQQRQPQGQPGKQPQGQQRPQPGQQSGKQSQQAQPQKGQQSQQTKSGQQKPAAQKPEQEQQTQKTESQKS